MFFTPSTICCGGVVLDYFTMLMIINELLPKEDEAEASVNVLRLWRIDMYSTLAGIYIFFFLFF